MSDEKQGESKGGVKRRTFLGTLGAGTLGAVVGAAAEAQPSGVVVAGEPVPVTLSVNGRRHRVMVEPRHGLLQVLRDQLGLTGTKPGCERGECGACTVLIDGVPRYACLTLALEAEAREVTTIEGLMDGESLGPVQQAFVDEDAFQCGFCTPGQVMAAEGLLRAKPEPTLDQIRHGMVGNLCRCGAYAHVFKAVRRAGELRRKGGAR